MLVDVGAGNGGGIGTVMPAAPGAAQATALSSTLPEGWQVFPARGEGQPTVTEVLEEMVDGAFDELVVVPLWPQFSRSTTGEVVKELYQLTQEALDEEAAKDAQFKRVYETYKTFRATNDAWDGISDGAYREALDR